MQTPNNLSLLSKYLLSLDDFIIFAHERPDGDAIGSAFGLQEALVAAGKKADLYMSELLAPKYQYLANNNTYFENNFPSKKYSNIICLDTATFERLSAFDKDNFSRANSINIDHHPDNTEFAKFNYIDPEACATSEIIFDLLLADPLWKINKRTADCLLMGILLDTGGLRFNNTSPGVLRKVADLIDSGADYHSIIKSMYFTRPLRLMNLEANIILNRLKIIFDNKFAYIYLSDNCLKKHMIDTRETEGLIDYFKTIDGVIITAVIIKHKDGYRVSLRSTNSDYPVNLVAKELSGGGHNLAAGCFIAAKNFNSAELILQSHIKKLLYGHTRID